MKYLSDEYWAWVRSEYPGEENYVRELWQEREQLRARIEGIEKKLLKYAPKEKED